MGLYEPSSDLLYLNVSCGFLVNKKLEISVRGYQGILKGIKWEEDEFEGKKIPKIKMLMEDPDYKEGDDEKNPRKKRFALVGFNAESWYAWTFFQRIKQVNLDLPFVIGVSGGDKNTNEKVSFCWMKQGKAIKKDETFPLPRMIKKGRKEELSTEESSKRVDEILAEIQDIVGDNITTKDMEPPEESSGNQSNQGENKDLPF